MSKLIKDGAIVENTWALIAKPEGDVADFNVPAGQVIVPLSLWLAQKPQLQTRTDEELFIDTYRRIGATPFKERVYAKAN